MIVSGNLVSIRNIIPHRLAFEKWSPSKMINATCERKVTCSQCLSKILFGINEIFWCSQAYPDTTREQNLLDVQNVYRYELTNFCNYISQTGTCDSWNDQEVIETMEYIGKRLKFLTQKRKPVRNEQNSIFHKIENNFARFPPPTLTQ
jgi:hypothetical protein